MQNPLDHPPPMDMNNIPRLSTHSRRPIATPSNNGGDVDPSLIQESHNVAMKLGDKANIQIEKEDDKGQF